MFYINHFLKRSKPHYERSPLSENSAVFTRTRTRTSKNYFIQPTMGSILNLCGRYAFFDTSVRLYAYFLLTTVFAFLGRLLHPLPEFYITRKRNPFNDYFVKFGLFWTITLLTPFVFFASKVYTGSNYFQIFRHLGRMLVNTFIWFVITTIFVHVEKWTGICSLRTHDDFRSCVQNGGHWATFEISGHCFLLVYCSMAIAEELLVFRDWFLIPAAVKRAAVTSSSNGVVEVDVNKETEILAQYRSWTPIVSRLFVALTLLMLSWDFMFLITSLYYHTWTQNMSGVAFAGVSWLLTYGLWYRTPYSPGMPGESNLKKYIDSKWNVFTAPVN